MTTLSVTATGQITLTQDLLQHMGIQYGQQVEVVKLPNNELGVKAKQQTGSISCVFGLLKGKTAGQVISIDEMNQAAWPSDESRLSVTTHRRKKQ